MLGKFFMRKPLLECDVQLYQSGEVFSFKVKENETLLEAALLQDVPIPYSCQVGSCGECRCQTIEGEVSHMKELGYIFDDEELSNGYTLACQTYPKTDLKLKVETNAAHVEGKVVRSVKLDENIYAVFIQANNSFAVHIGQYLKLENENKVSRYYSIVSKRLVGSATEFEVHIGIKPQGKMSTWWQTICQEALCPIIKIEPAQGNYSVKGQNNVIAVAGGSGVGVTAGLLEQYLEQNHIASSALIAVFKGGESHYFRQVSESLKLKFGSRVLIKIIDQIDFYQDEFQLNLPEVLQQNQSKISGLICGSSYLVNQCKSLYKDYGLTEDNISYDEFI